MGRLPYNTFEFFVDFKNAKVGDDQHHLMTPIHRKVMSDATDEPIEGATIYISGNTEHDKGAVAKTDQDGYANLNIMTQVEYLSVISEKVLVVNIENNQSFFKECDWIAYFSFRPFGRIVTILPLVEGVSTPWKKARIGIQHKAFLPFLQEHFPQYGIIEISPVF